MTNLHAFVITLPNSLDRQERAKHELSKTNISWSFLDAIDGRKLAYPISQYKEYKVRKLLGFPLTPSEIGCFLSHQKAWKECVRTKIPILVFEDDFVILPNFSTTLESLMQDLSSWNLVRLQALTTISHSAIKTLGTSLLVKNQGDPLGATAYLIQPPAAQILIDHSHEIFEPLDHFIEHQKFHGVSCLAVHPYCVDISHMETTIADRPNEERKPKKGFLKLKRSIARWCDRSFSQKPWFPK